MSLIHSGVFPRQCLSAGYFAQEMKAALRSSEVWAGTDLRLHGYDSEGPQPSEMIDIAYAYAPGEFFREKNLLLLIRFSKTSRT